MTLSNQLKHELVTAYEAIGGQLNYHLRALIIGEITERDDFTTYEGLFMDVLGELNENVDRQSRNLERDSS